MKRAFALVLFLLGLGTLIGLGTWQYQRLHWKNAIIAALDAQYETLSSKNTSLNRAAMTDALAAQDNPFIVDTLSGRIIPDKAVFIGPRSINTKGGYDVVVPVRIDDGTVLAQIGWVRETDRAALSLPRGTVIMHGIARKPDYSRHASGNSPENELWFKIDIGQIAQARGLDNVAPLVFFAYDMTPPVAAIDIPHTRWYPRNKHHEYMIFWFGMAAAWIAVFALAWRRQRQG